MIGERVRQQIKKSPLSYSDVARALGIDKSTLQRLLNSDSIRTHYLEQLSLILNVPIAVFFDENFEKPPDKGHLVIIAVMVTKKSIEKNSVSYYGFDTEMTEDELLKKVRAAIGQKGPKRRKK